MDYLIGFWPLLAIIGYIVVADMVILSQYFRWLVCQRQLMVSLTVIFICVLLGSMYAANDRKIWALLTVLLPIFRFSIAWRYKILPKYQLPLLAAFVISAGLLATFPSHFFDVRNWQLDQMI
jgi:hypothetical protein